MTSNAGGAFVELIPQIGRDFERQAAYQLEGAITGVGKGLSGKIGTILGGALAVGGGVALGAGLEHLASASIAEATEAQKVGAQTEAVLKSTAGAANVSADAAGALATQLSNISGVDDEVIQQAENVLLTFTNVKNAVGSGNDIFNQATGAALDMSKALGVDLQGATIQVGKALNDPIKGVTALQRVGVSFTQQQRDQIAAMVAAGDQMGAQKLILGELQKEFGGTAAAVATPWEKFNVILKNTEENLGGALMPAVNALAPALGGVLTALSPVLTSLGTALAPVVTALVPVFTALAPPVGVILGLLAQLLVPVAGLLSALAPVVGIILQLAAVFLAALMPAITPLIGALTQVVNVVAAALQPVIAQIVPIIQQNAGVYVQLVQAVLPLIPALAQILVALLPILPPLLELLTLQLRLIGLAAPLIAFLAGLAAILLGAVAGAIKTVVAFVRDDLIGWFEKLPGRVGDAIGQVVGFITGLPGRIGGVLGDVFRPLWEGFKKWVNFLIRGWNSLHFGIPEFDTHIPGVGKIGGGSVGVPQIPYLAHGGDVTAGGFAVVGDRGPELLNLPAGATVSPLSVSNSRGYGDFVIPVRIDVDSREFYRGTIHIAAEELENYRVAHAS